MLQDVFLNLKKLKLSRTLGSNREVNNLAKEEDPIR
jgi:hypothetical protein